MFVLLALVHFLSTVSGGRGCGRGNETTYLRSEGLRLMEFATHSLSQVTLNTCAESCTTEVNGHSCSSFEYDAQAQECAMHAEDGQPLGPSVLAKAEPPLAFFQQICVAENRLCPTPYAFERHPQAMLVGHALHVEVVGGLSECLSLCLSPFLSVPCNSIMYFYETGECIVNRATRQDAPNLFKDGIADVLVDYFENVCQDVDCGGGVLHWIRSEDFHIAPRKDVIVESNSIEECRALCTANNVGEERFPCRAFIFSGSKGECHLSAEAGIATRSSASQTAQLSPISAGEYFQKYCLNTTVRCVDASFEHVTNRKIGADPYKASFEIKRKTVLLQILPAPSVHACLSLCIDEGASCASVTFDKLLDECLLSDKSQFSHPELFLHSDATDYFDKICDTAALEEKKALAAPRVSVTNPLTTSEDPSLLLEENLDKETEPITEVKAATFGETHTETEETVVDDDEDFEENSSLVSESHVKAHLTSECRMSGVTVGVSFSQNTSGSIYVKDHFASCRSLFTDSRQIELHIPFPRSDEGSPRCPGVEMSPSHWSFMIVVQRNEMSSPSLVTSTDRIFNVTCDYTKLIERDFNLGRDVELKSNKIKMSILRGGAPVTVVPLGEKVELRWTVVDPEAGLGFFVSECVAERVGGSPPEPEPLKIIYRGCPEERVQGKLINDPVEQIPGGFSTRLKTFRFDGSRRVRIKCAIDVCVDECPAVVCDGDLKSFGRKKRSPRDKPDFSHRGQRNTVIGTLTVVEREKQTTTERKPRPEFLASEERFCVSRWQATAAAIAAVVLFSTGLLALAWALHNLCSEQQDDDSCSSSISGLTHGSGYSVSTCQQPRVYDEPRRIR